MVDTFSSLERSRIMRLVKSKCNRSTELKLIFIFKRLNLSGWRRKYALSGSPDFVFPKRKLAVFADGCFWHGHNCRNLTPAFRRTYWTAKIQKNKKRDRRVTSRLKREGWKVLRIWECDLKESLVLKKFQRLFTLV